MTEPMEREPFPKASALSVFGKPFSEVVPRKLVAAAAWEAYMGTR